MNFKLLATAFVATSLVAGAAIAQEDSPGRSPMEFTSPDEQAMYEDNSEIMGGFFTDETMSEMVSEEDMMANWEGYSEEEQAQLMTACERAMENRGSYGTVTIGLCEQLGAM